MALFSLQNDEVEFVRTGYGKDMVKVLYIRRDGKYHTIKEVATSVQLTLSSKKDYVDGDNSDIIPTDTIKNTVHVLAKFKGVCFFVCLTSFYIIIIIIIVIIAVFYSLCLDLNSQHLLGRESYSTILHVISWLASLGNQNPEHISERNFIHFYHVFLWILLCIYLFFLLE